MRLSPKLSTKAAQLALAGVLSAGAVTGGAALMAPAANAHLTGPTTFAECEWRVQAPGAVSGCVGLVQMALNTCRNDALKIDGHFGHRTAAAVRSFQRSRTLHDDAVVGPHTWRALRGCSHLR